MSARQSLPASNSFNLDVLLTCEHLGFGFSFGIFQDYYSSHEPFSSSSSIAAIGTTTSVS